MTIQAIKLFAPTVLTTGAVTLFTMPPAPSNVVLSRGLMRFTNTDSAGHTVTAYAVPLSGSALVANTFCPGVTVPANSYLDVAIPVMGAGDFLQALASVGTVVSVQAMDGILIS